MCSCAHKIHARPPQPDFAQTPIDPTRMYRRDAQKFHYEDERYFFGENCVAINLERGARAHRKSQKRTCVHARARDTYFPSSERVNKCIQLPCPDSYIPTRQKEKSSYTVYFRAAQSCRRKKEVAGKKLLLRVQIALLPCVCFLHVAAFWKGGGGRR